MQNIQRVSLGEVKPQFRIKKRILSAGSISDEYFDLLIELAPIHSEKVIDALREYLVYGETRKSACINNGVALSYMSTCMGRLFRTEQLILQTIPFLMHAA